MPGIENLSLYDVFALPLHDQLATEAELLELVCHRHYYIYLDDQGVERRISLTNIETLPGNTEYFPVWTRDHPDQVAEWTNVNPADVAYENTEWTTGWTNEVGEGWARVRAREPEAEIP